MICGECKIKDVVIEKQELELKFVKADAYHWRKQHDNLVMTLDKIVAVSKIPATVLDALDKQEDSDRDGAQLQ